MIKVYVMATCPDCTQVKAEAANDPPKPLVPATELITATCALCTA